MKEKHNRKSKGYYQKNKDKINEWRRLISGSQRDELNKKRKKYREANKDKINERNRLRRAKLKREIE